MSKLFNKNQILFLLALTDSYQSFYELSKKTGFSIEEIELLVLDFIEQQSWYNRFFGANLEYIIINKFSPFKIKIGID